jgi:hypothetical protein
MEKTDKIKSKLIGFAERIKADVFEISKMGRARMDILTVRKEMNELFKSLGKRTYEMLKLGNLSQAELKEVSDSIKDLEDRIRAIELNVEDISKKRRHRKYHESLEKTGRKLKQEPEDEKEGL